jgi:hypothetical protein
VRSAKSRLEAAVRALKEKLQRSSHQAAKQTITRALGDVDEVIDAGDPAEIDDLHKQLQEQRETILFYIYFSRSLRFFLHFFCYDTDRLYMQERKMKHRGTMYTVVDFC